MKHNVILLLIIRKSGHATQFRNQVKLLVITHHPCWHLDEMDAKRGAAGSCCERLCCSESDNTLRTKNADFLCGDGKWYSNSFQNQLTNPVSLLVVVCHNHLYNKFGFNQSLWNEKTKKQKQKLFKSLTAIEEEASYLSVTARLTNLVRCWCCCCLLG